MRHAAREARHKGLLPVPATVPCCCALLPRWTRVANLNLTPTLTLLCPAPQVDSTRRAISESVRQLSAQSANLNTQARRAGGPPGWSGARDSQGQGQGQGQKLERGQGHGPGAGSEAGARAGARGLGQGQGQRQGQGRGQGPRRPGGQCPAGGPAAHCAPRAPARVPAVAAQPVPGGCPAAAEGRAVGGGPARTHPGSPGHQGRWRGGEFGALAPQEALAFRVPSGCLQGAFRV